MDRCSGGDVKFYRFDGKNNLTETIRFEGLRSKFVNEGMIMRTDQQTGNELIPIHEAVKTDPEIANLAHTIESGEAEILSPCEEMYKPWSAEEKRRFDRVTANMVKQLEKN
jgi:hypothetical protein